MPLSSDATCDRKHNPEKTCHRREHAADPIAKSVKQRLRQECSRLDSAQPQSLRAKDLTCNSSGTRDTPIWIG